MPNYKISIQYDGTDYCGWQFQPNVKTIQDEIVTAIEKITSEKINLIGSGRTDSGVHAFEQVANFNISQPVNEYKFIHSLNSVLPYSISIKKLKLVDNSFHSRFDAKKRSYIYFINRQKSPFYFKYSYQYPQLNKIDFESLKCISKVLIGNYDFTSFCKTKTDTENKICNVYDIGWRSSKDLILFKIEADRFLHGMVRTIVGTLLYANINNYDSFYLNEILKEKTREAAKESVPSKGLFLYKVKYK